VRDFTIVGGITGFLAPYFVIHDLAYSAVTDSEAPRSGALLGPLLSGIARRAQRESGPSSSS